MSQPFGGDPLAFGRQLWETWSRSLQDTVPGAAAIQMPDLGEAAHQWSRLAQGESAEIARATEMLGEHGRQFFELMQGLARRTGVGSSSEGDLVGFWRDALRGDGNPMLDAMRHIGTDGARGWEQLAEAADAAMGPLKDQLSGHLRMPGFGPAREQQARQAALAQARGAFVEALQAYQGLLARAGKRGFELFEHKLGERSEPGRQIDSMRALYDLWIDAAEEGYAEVALAPEFRTAYGRLVNAQMQLTRLQRQEIERWAAQCGLPTRSELDGVLRKLRDTQAELRALRATVAGSASGKPAATSEAAPPVRPAAASAGKAKPASGRGKAKAAKPAKPSVARGSKPEKQKKAGKAKKPGKSKKSAKSAKLTLPTVTPPLAPGSRRAPAARRR